MVKYLLLILCANIFMGPLQAQTQSASIAFEKRMHDFGTIPEKNGKVSYTFIFKNNGKDPVVISDVYSGCGCIGKAVSDRPVKPGEKGKVTITFNPDYKSGFFSKEIVVFSDNNKQYSRIWVQGHIKPMEHPVESDYPYNFGDGLYLRLKVLAFGYMKPGETKQVELHYANDTGKEMTLKFLTNGLQQGLKYNDPGKIAPGAKAVVRFSYTMPYINNGDISFRIFPYVNGKKLQESLELRALKSKQAGSSGAN